MKLVIALIKPFKLEEVKDALARIGLEGIIVSEVKGFGHQKGHIETFRGTEYTVDFHPRVRIEVAVADELKDKVVATFVAAAHTGTPGDGRVFVLPLEEVTRIDTAQQGTEAL
ncbi:MAG: P-II family nitrogen regulator [Candidatus Didemnitutus sp.]|nr:P-II family nitrogen regulator [Candidatus Didemnitutus sp.]